MHNFAGWRDSAFRKKAVLRPGAIAFHNPDENVLGPPARTERHQGRSRLFLRRNRRSAKALRHLATVNPGGRRESAVRMMGVVIGGQCLQPLRRHDAFFMTTCQAGGGGHRN